MPFTYDYPRPAVTVDVVLISGKRRRGAGTDWSVLMIRRKNPPFKGSWALPGGFVDENEALEHAAARELREETGLVQNALTQIGAFGAPGRDPRGHTVSVAYYAVVAGAPEPVAADDAADAAWVPVHDLVRGTVAFDHARIITRAFECLRDNKGRPRARRKK
jgi:8-oxo-dGTP diphosphatase